MKQSLWYFSYDFSFSSPFSFFYFLFFLLSFFFLLYILYSEKIPGAKIFANFVIGDSVAKIKSTNACLSIEIKSVNAIFPWFTKILALKNFWLYSILYVFSFFVLLLSFTPFSQLIMRWDSECPLISVTWSWHDLIELKRGVSNLMISYNLVLCSGILSPSILLYICYELMLLFCNLYKNYYFYYTVHLTCFSFSMFIATFCL